MGYSQFDDASRERAAWNAGKEVGKRPFTQKQIWVIRFSGPDPDPAGACHLIRNGLEAMEATPDKRGPEQAPLRDDRMDPRKALRYERGLPLPGRPSGPAPLRRATWSTRCGT